VVTALYRRYRPETFAELIGQTHVTEPLGQALSSDRVNHAYLFSGPRGCGKTTSARILARCLNCAQGPTDTPCGTCPSCIELSRDGGGSLDVVEIDAASHNGVDDARDLRERAVFAPARDRFKIFILDEAHMVTQQGFNALLKIVEEPPDHVKFIFATTEPDKVIGTIRSRTHHYPFRLVPPAEVLGYLEKLCNSEGVDVQEGVLPLVVRAGGGSVRDTLSILDQLIAGSTESGVTYDRAVALLGYTHGELLAEVTEAIAEGHGPATFQALEKVIQTGQDPRRFAEDLLEYVRDIIIADAAGSSAAALLPGASQGAIDAMTAISKRLGTANLSHIADVVNDALTSMTGATSPKLHLELLMARLLVHRAGSAGETSSSGSQASAAVAPPAPKAPPQPPAPTADAPEPESAKVPLVEPQAPLSLQLLQGSWSDIVESIGEKKRAVWSALVNTEVVSLSDDVVTIGFPALANAEVLKKPQGPGLSVNAELVRDAILQVTGHRVRFKVQELIPPDIDSEATAEDGPVQSDPVQSESPSVESTHTASWPTAVPPGTKETEPAAAIAPEAAVGDPEHTVDVPNSPLSQIGEAVIREVLGGELISEHPVDEAGDR